MKKELRFDYLELDDQTDIPDLLEWVNSNELSGLVDEEKGGIIGYINRYHINELCTILNKQVVQIDADRLNKMNNIIRTCYHVLNRIPNQKLNMIEGKDTYTIASVIGKFMNYETGLNE